MIYGVPRRHQNLKNRQKLLLGAMGALTPKRHGLGKTSRYAIYALGSDYRTLPVRWESVENRARQTPRNNVPIRKMDLEIFKVQKWVFHPYLRSGANVVHEIWDTRRTCIGEFVQRDREQLTSFLRFYRPPNFHPNIWGPLSPDWGQISGRALHHSVGVCPVSKFGTYENFCGGTLSRSKLRGKNRQNFWGRIWGCSEKPTSTKFSGTLKDFILDVCAKNCEN